MGSPIKYERFGNHRSKSQSLQIWSRQYHPVFLTVDKIQIPSKLCDCSLNWSMMSKLHSNHRHVLNISSDYFTHLQKTVAAEARKL